MQQIIRLEPDEEIQGIRAHIDMAELSHVVLLVPRKCVALKSDYEWELLRRAADDAGVVLALVTRNVETRENAARFGFAAFETLAEARSSPWIVNPAPAERLASFEPPEHFGLTSLPTLPRPPKMGPRQWAILGAIGFASFCVLCFSGILFIPAANVRIVPSTIAVTLSTDITADPSISQVNPTTRSVPARRISRETSGSGQLNTTTQKSVPNAPSTGTVIFTNLRTEKTDIPVGTIVKTSAGVPIRFSTTAAASLPAGINSRVEVPIQAVVPGPTGNVKELAINTIEGSIALEARVINVRATASGSLKPVKVVTAEDKKKLEATVLQQLQKQGMTLLQKDLKEGEVLPPDSIIVEADSEVFDRAVDEPADVLNLSVSATAYGLAVETEDLQTLLKPLVQKQLQAGYQLLPAALQVDPTPGGKYQGGALRYSVRATGYTTPLLDRGKLSSALQGKSVEQAKEYLAGAIQLARPPEINVSPFGWNRLPWVGFRIAVFVEPQAVSQR